jgi:hypothetical protein
MTAILRTRPVARCPSCRNPLDGGPVVLRCTSCVLEFHAADIPAERSLTIDCAYLHSAFGAGCPHCTARKAA